MPFDHYPPGVTRVPDDEQDCELCGLPEWECECGRREDDIADDYKAGGEVP